MSKASRERQIAEADISGNWTGMVGYQKTKRRKLPLRDFRSGINGTLNLGRNAEKRAKRLGLVK